MSKPARTGSIRDQILDTALRLFCENGYFNTSIHDIQQASAVSMGSIYNYFGGKSAIAQALYDMLLERMETVVDQAIRENRTAHDRGKAIVTAIFNLAEGDSEMMGFILNARHREFLVDKRAICSSRPFSKMRDILIEGMDKGEVRVLDPWLAASLAFGPALRMVVLRLDGMLERPLTDETEQLWELTWQSLTPPVACPA